MKFCDTPVIATYVPDGVSSNWKNDWIMHDSHGGRMFEETEDALNHINPDSLTPHAPVNPSEYKSEFKSMAPKSPDYHDSPEYRKSLHLQGEEKEVLLSKLRARLGMAGAAGAVSPDVQQHQGVDTGPAGGDKAGSAYTATAAASYETAAPTTTAEATTTQYKTPEPTTTTEGKYEEVPTYTEPQPDDPETSSNPTPY
jgi:hypothetical protein